MNTTAKFLCKEVKLTAEGSSVVMEPVTSGSPENEKFFRFTPWGKLEMGIVNPSVNFKPGKEYYIQISEGPDGEKA